ncbi:hypothetical protein [uncultured Roseobacter sp.]|uniref:hypothetical protein n=1 Tax=uncultured Roseobacter sp. TaxID=114847 RepID=UPI002639AF5F|nr:hypothetical protein [uncultured Roseobacter sp.]
MSEADKSQLDRFKKAARQLETDDDEEQFKKLARLSRKTTSRANEVFIYPTIRRCYEPIF